MCKLLEVSDLVRIEYENAMFLEDMNTSELMIHSQQVEGDKLREMDKDNKKFRIWNYVYCQHTLGGLIHLQFEQVFLSPTSS